MSLEDELTSLLPPSTTQWISEWYAKLSTADRKTWDSWLADSTKPSTVMFRVIRAKGYPGGETTFRHWVHEHRDLS
jgi:hypothetical protein